MKKLRLINDLFIQPDKVNEQNKIGQKFTNEEKENENNNINS